LLGARSPASLELQARRYVGHSTQESDPKWRRRGRRAAWLYRWAGL